MTSILSFSKPSAGGIKRALVAGFIGGNLSSFVKWGSENPFPPRPSGRAIPPFEMIQDMGLNASAMTYEYSGHVVNWGVAGIHHLFSLVFAILYCVVAQYFPLIKLWQGMAFGVVLTLGFHGVVLPTFGWAPPIWDLSGYELFSETFGHVLFAWTIELVRRAYCDRAKLSVAR